MKRWVKVSLIGAGVFGALFSFYVWNSWPTWYPERYRR